MGNLLPAALISLCATLLGYATLLAAPRTQEPPPLLPSTFESRPSISAQSAMDAEFAAAATTSPAAFLIELDDEPAVRVYVAAQARATDAESVAATQAQLQRIENTQTTLLATPPLDEAQVIYRVQRTFNGVAVRVDTAVVDQIAALPGVRAVYPLPTYEIELGLTVPFVGAPELWDALRLAGVDGNSISIGIVDTGIDYLHRDFGGPGVGYQDNDPTRTDDLHSYPSAKVVGGYDFVGDAYTGSADSSTLRPDPDPMDCWGHGTHVAGIAAGYGTLTNGNTYTGTYSADLNFAQFGIGPGVAPRANLYALKVFGCSGATQVVEQAIDWAVDPNQDGDFSDRLDVLNLSLGSSFGSPDSPTSIAIDNAVQAGIVVVAAAGNTGDTYYNVAGPGVATRAVSVAASSTQSLSAPQSSTPVDAVASFTARGPRRADSILKPDISAPGYAIASAAAGTGSGRRISSGTSMATPHVAGAAALLRQLHPGWTVEEIKARLINLARYDLVTTRTYPPVRYSAARTGAGRLALASADGSPLLFYNSDNSGAVSLSFGAPEVPGKLTMLHNARLTNTSSRPQRVVLDYAPAVDLPGVEIEILGDAERQIDAYGEDSVAVALHADASELRNVADPTVAPRNVFPRHRLGEESGFVYVWPQPTTLNAVLLPVDRAIADEIGGSAQSMLDPATRRLSVTLSITSSTPVTINAVHLRYGSAYETGPVLHVLSSTLAPAATSVRVEATAVLSQSEMALLAADRIYVSLDVVGIQDESAGTEIRGQLATHSAVLRLPVYAAPRAASSMRGEVAWLDLGEALTAVESVPLVGQGLLQSTSLTAGNFPTDTVSIVSALELQHSSPDEVASVGIFNHADLKYVGVATNPLLREGALQSLPVAQRRVIFGIVTHGEWSTPNEVTFRVFIDTNEDGWSDHILSTSDLGTNQGNSATDEFITVLDSFQEGRRITYFVNLISAAELQTALFNNNVLLMAVDADALGLDDDNSDFRYRVGAFSRDAEMSWEPVDMTPDLYYDVANPGVVSSADAGHELPMFYDLPGRALTFHLDRSNLRRNHSGGILLIHHHNVAGRRAEVIEIRTQWTLYWPLVSIGNQ
ncbi:MAG: S8 family serine peptidase [Caldilineaceae bacterium]